MADKITHANYAEELTKIELPYFRELVDLVSLERLCLEYEKKLPKEIRLLIEKQLQSLNLPQKPNLKSPNAPTNPS